MGLQQHWSTTAASNGVADSAINLAEGQAPSTLNDAARGVMARVRAWFLDTSGSIVTGGTSTAYTFTTNEGFTSLTDGMVVRARMHATNGAAPTLNVDGRGAVPIQSAQGTAVPTGALLIGTIHAFTYYAASAAWIVDAGVGIAGTLGISGGGTGATTAAGAATALGLGTGDSPQFAGINLGHASDTTLTRVSAGDIAVEGNGVYRAGGTDVPIADGGTGASTATLARDNLGLTYASTADQKAASSGAAVVAPSSQKYHPAHPKAFGRFNSSGTLIGTSFNVSSVVRNSTGNYTVNLTAAMTDTNYGIQCTANSDPGGGSVIIYITSITTSSFVVQTRNGNNGVALDVSVCVTVFGDLP